MKQIHQLSLLALCLLPLIQGCGGEQKAKEITAETNVDQTALYFMKTAMQSGTKEIAAGKLGVQKASNPRVRAFATMMVHDHEQSAQELLKLSDKKLVTPNMGIMPQEKQTLDSIGKLSGAEFDSAFMSLMIKDHEKAITVYKEGADNRSNAVQKFALKQLPALQAHLDSARQISSALTTK